MQILRRAYQVPGTPLSLWTKLCSLAPRFLAESRSTTAPLANGYLVVWPCAQSAERPYAVHEVKPILQLARTADAQNLGATMPTGAPMGISCVMEI